MIGVAHHRFPKKRFCRLADCSIANADWPLGAPAEGVETFGDLTESDHLVLEARSKTLLADLRGLRCRVSLMPVEPPAIHGRYYRAVRWLAGRYHRVLTHNTRLLAELPNARFLPHGGCWLTDPPTGDVPKSRLVSLIASKKRHTEGHKLRHRVADWARREGVDLDLYGSGYEPLEHKEAGHAPHRYSVVLENSREPGYFTEKLVDSLLCESLPIYWGAPDIEHFFDPRGMIVCRSEADVRSAVRSASDEGFAHRLPFLRENRRRARAYADHPRNAALVLQREDEAAGLFDDGLTVPRSEAA